MSVYVNVKTSRVRAKTQIIAVIASVAAAVVLPQLAHIAGTCFGVGGAIGEMLLPMHIPVMLAGLFAGAYAGAAAGIISPIISFALSGMPSSAILPFMMAELAVYGLCMGLMKDKKLPCVTKVVTAQVVGRAVRAAAILVSVYVFGNTSVNPHIIISGISAGVLGIALQWLIIPVLFAFASKIKND